MSAPAATHIAAPLVGAGWVADHAHDPHVRFVEVDVSRAAYDDGHVDGAVHWNAYSDLRHPDYTPIDAAALERLLGRSGITSDTTCAFYGYAAHLGFWLMHAYGHAHAVLIDEPRDAVVSGGTTDMRLPAPTTYRLGAATSLVTRAELLATERVVLDVRAESEFAGERFWPSGAPEDRGRPGHVPGAVNVPIGELRTDAGFTPAREMRAALERRGVSRDARVITYCTIGNRASQAWFALTYLLGFRDAAVYYGGWAEWGMDPTTPVHESSR